MGWMAALLAAGACAAGGRAAALRLEKREKLLRQWEGALSRMERMVERGGAPLTETLRRGAGERVDLLNHLADVLEASPAQDPAEAVARLSWEALLSAPEKETLIECLLSLFSPDTETQARALGYARTQWTVFCRSAREIREKNSRLYASMGWLAGAGVFILLC